MHLRKPLLVRYDLASLGASVKKQDLILRGRDIWRYQEFLPVERPENIVTLGEGYTPILPAVALGSRWGLRSLFIKDEGQMPTGSFKARGLAMAVSKAKELECGERRSPRRAMPRARWRRTARVPVWRSLCSCLRIRPKLTRRRASWPGARVYLVDGLINDCGRIVGEGKKRVGWFDVSTLKEPYRIEARRPWGWSLRAVRLAAAGLDRLPDGWRHRFDRDVEGL